MCMDNTVIAFVSHLQRHYLFLQDIYLQQLDQVKSSHVLHLMQTQLHGPLNIMKLHL